MTAIRDDEPTTAALRADVAAANHDNGFEGLNPYDAIRAERGYQDRKWGGPNHDREHSFLEWSLILGREYGEVLSAIGGVLWPSDRAPNTSAWDRHMALRAELVQVAAVAVAIIEQMEPAPTPPPAPAPDEAVLTVGARVIRTGTLKVVGSEYDSPNARDHYVEWDSGGGVWYRRDEIEGLAAPADRAVVVTDELVSAVLREIGTYPSGAMVRKVRASLQAALRPAPAGADTTGDGSK